MATLHHGPCYALLQPSDLTQPSRRRFLSGSALVVGFALSGGTKALAKSEASGVAASGQAFDGFAPGGFIRIARDGSITLVMPSVEMGQGIYTGEAMLIAEEVEVGLDQVSVMPAPPNEKLYAQPLLRSQATGGSTSIRGTWQPLREAGAAARTMLVAAAAERWRVPPAQCVARRGAVHRADGSAALSYGDLVADAMRQPLPGKVALKPAEEFTLIGQTVPRVDTRAKVDGSACYGIDVRLPGMKVAALEICPVQGGRLLELDDSAARALPGVVDVLRIDDAVAVVGDHYWAARKGADALKIRWDFGGRDAMSSATMWSALEQASQTGKAVAAPAVGDADQALASAPKRIDAVYRLPMLAHATMEPINTTIHVRGDRCEVWLGTQVPTAAQAAVAAACGISPDRVTVHNHLIGGGFGRRLAVDTVTQAALFAKQVSYPLKVVWRREQDIGHDHFRPAYYDRVAAGLGADGLPVAWTHRTTGASVLADFLPGGFPPGVLDTDAVEGAAKTPYHLPATRVDWVRYNGPRKVNWWRGVGPTHNVFVVESFLDECAHAAGRDPVEYRRALLGDNPRARNVLDIAAARAGWGMPTGARTGRGVSLHDSFGSFIALVVEVAVSSAGEIRLQKLTCAVDCGIVINPDSVRAQVEGGTIFGLSAALYNGITLAGGRVEQSNFNNYRQMRINEVPPFDITIVKSAADPGGMGETATVSAAPALANAIFAATGVRLRTLPIDQTLLAQAKPAI